MDRNKLLQDRIQENKDLQTILVSIWHPKLNAIPSILKITFILSPAIPNFQIFSYKSLLLPTDRTKSFLIKLCKTTLLINIFTPMYIFWKMQTLPADEYTKTHH